jgi:hypothetical protein
MGKWCLIKVPVYSVPFAVKEFGNETRRYINDNPENSNPFADLYRR